MPPDRSLVRDLALAAGYFAAAAVTVSTTRFNGGVAMLWIASALLIPALAYRPRETWPRAIALCGAASVAVTGLFGFGWQLAVPFALVNMVEAYVGAVLLVRWRNDPAPMDSLGWLGHFALAAGLAAPTAAGLLAMTVLAVHGFPPVATFRDFFVGHALGNLAFVPIFALLMSGSIPRLLRGFTRRQAAETAILLLAVAAASAVSFSTTTLPLLFLPLAPIVLAVFRGGQIGAAMSIVLLALIGGGLTMANQGPVMLIDAPHPVHVQFFQFYLAVVVVTMLPVAADLGNRARLYREIRISEERYRMMADHSGDIMMHLDRDGQIRFVSPSITQLAGYDPREMTGRMAMDFVSLVDAEKVRDAHARTLSLAGATHRYDYRARLSDGRERWFEASSRAVLDIDGKVEAVLSVIRDVSDRKRAEANLSAAALTDSLTELPNRRAFRATAEQVLASGRQVPGCVAVLDLDHFKRVNDRFGHDGGDAVLRSFAAKAAESVRDGDVVARIGGEEFALLLPGATIDSAARICERLRLSVAEMSVDSPAGAIRVTVSGGVAELGSDGLDAALKRADLALYEAKGGGRDQLCLAA